MPSKDVVRIAIENAPPGNCVVIASRALPGDDFALPCANRMIELIEWEPLKVTREEARGIAQLHAPMDDRLLDDLHERSGGWAAGLILLAERVKRGAGLEDQGWKGRRKARFRRYRLWVEDRRAHRG